MCGIAGFISKKPLSSWASERLCSALLYYSEDRGSQSTGIFINGTLFKKAMNACEFIELDEYNKLFTQDTSAALLHTRQPTSGGKGDDQAQPFISGTTVTVHNGWFTNIHELKRRWNIQKASGVDSELVTSFIDSYGIMKLPQFLKSSEGSSAFAIIYKNELYLMRSGNPTAYTIIDLADGNTVFVFASTPKILAMAIRYVWLIQPYHSIKETKEGILLHITPEIITKMSARVSSQSRSWKDWNGNDAQWARWAKKKYRGEINPYEDEMNDIRKMIGHIEDNDDHDGQSIMKPEDYYGG